MFYILTEIQRIDTNKSVSSVTYDDKKEAISAFYTKAAYIPLTTADEMAVMLYKSDGSTVLQTVYSGNLNS